MSRIVCEISTRHPVLSHHWASHAQRSGWKELRNELILKARINAVYGLSSGPLLPFDCLSDSTTLLPSLSLRASRACRSLPYIPTPFPGDPRMEYLTADY